MSLSKDILRAGSGLLVAATIAGCASPVPVIPEPTKIESPTPTFGHGSLRVVGESALGAQDLAEKEKIGKVCEALSPGVNVEKTVGWNVVDDKGREIDLWVCTIEKDGLENVVFVGFNDPKANKLYGNNPMKEIGHYMSPDGTTEQMVAFYRDENNKIDPNSLVTLASLDTRRGSASTRQSLTMTVIDENGNGKEVEVASTPLGGFDAAIHSFGSYLDGLNKVGVVKAEAPTDTPIVTTVVPTSEILQPTAVATKAATQPAQPTVDVTKAATQPASGETEQQKEDAQIVQRSKDFLAGVGNFSDDKINNLGYIVKDGENKDPNIKNGLGVMQQLSDGKVSFIQVIDLGTTISADGKSLIFYAGCVEKGTGKRIIYTNKNSWALAEGLGTAIMDTRFNDFSHLTTGFAKGPDLTALLTKLTGMPIMLQVEMGQTETIQIFNTVQRPPQNMASLSAGDGSTSGPVKIYDAQNPLTADIVEADRKSGNNGYVGFDAVFYHSDDYYKYSFRP